MKGNRLSVEESIRLEAYLLSERAGHPAGMEHTFWVQAEAMVHGQTAAVAPSVVKKPRKAAADTTVSVAKPAAKARKPAGAAKTIVVQDERSPAPKSPSLAKARSRSGKRKEADG